MVIQWQSIVPESPQCTLEWQWRNNCSFQWFSNFQFPVCSNLHKLPLDYRCTVHYRAMVLRITLVKMAEPGEPTRQFFVIFFHVNTTTHICSSVLEETTEQISASLVLRSLRYKSGKIWCLVRVIMFEEIGRARVLQTNGEGNLLIWPG